MTGRPGRPAVVDLGGLADVRAPWRADAACKGMPADRFFPASDYDHETIRLALSVCADCPVQRDCAEAAIPHPDLDGIWGGTTPRQRRRIRARRRAAA